MTPRALRLTRGWVAAFVATGAAVLGHVVGGGTWPSPMLFALCVALSAPVCMLLAGLKLPLVGLSAAVAVSQGLFHVLLSLSGGYAAASDHTGHVAHTGAGHGLAPSAGPELVLVPTTDMGAHAMHAHEGVTGAGFHWLDAVAAPMLLTHLLAGVAAILVLRHGEAGLLRSMATLLVRVVRLVRSVEMPWVNVRPWHPVFRAPLPARALVWARGPLRYRGPPWSSVLV